MLVPFSRASNLNSSLGLEPECRIDNSRMSIIMRENNNMIRGPSGDGVRAPTRLIKID